MWLRRRVLQVKVKVWAGLVPSRGVPCPGWRLWPASQSQHSVPIRTAPLTLLVVYKTLVSTLGPPAWSRAVSTSQDSSLITSSEPLQPREATWSQVSGVRAWTSLVGHSSATSSFLMSERLLIHLFIHLCTICPLVQPASLAFLHLSFCPILPSAYLSFFYPSPTVYLIVPPPSISPNFHLSFPSSVHLSVQMGQGAKGGGLEDPGGCRGDTGWSPNPPRLCLDQCSSCSQLLPGTIRCHHPRCHPPPPPDNWLPLPHPPAQSRGSQKTEAIADPPSLSPRPTEWVSVCRVELDPLLSAECPPSQFRSSPRGHKGTHRPNGLTDAGMSGSSLTPRPRFLS
nr:uncharacterized protein LOC116158477 [Camelus dromedarius]